MRIVKIIISLTLMLILFAPSVMAQSKDKSQIITEYNGKQYYIHPVQKKQTLKDISVIYDVSVYDIMKENKDLKKNLKSGDIVRIPYIEKKQEQEVVVEDYIMEEQDTIQYIEDFLFRDIFRWFLSL